MVGRVNMGKSSVLATLLEIDDNQIIPISATPGETTRCHAYPLAFNQREYLRFIDTPGFTRPVEALRTIQQLHGPGTPTPDTLRRFIATQADNFADEARLLAPLLEAQGAGILYVVDPGLPLRDDFVAEMEILRWTGQPRLALLNQRGASPSPYLENWRSRLGSTFNLVRTFNAHHARYPERLRLLRSLLEIDEGHRSVLEETIYQVEAEWRARRDAAAEAILDFLQRALGMRVHATLDVREINSPERRARKQADLQGEYYAKLAELERACSRELLRIYRHHLLEVDQHAQQAETIDLQSSETWRKWGLSRVQLTTVAALGGAAAGGVVDLGTGGLTHGLGALTGALGSAAAAWFKGHAIPELKLDWRGIQMAGATGRALSVGPPRSENFPWVLLDAMLLRYQRILARAHGRRDRQSIDGGAGEASLTRQFPDERRQALARWFAACLKGRADADLEAKALAAIDAALAEASTMDA